MTSSDALPGEAKDPLSRAFGWRPLVFLGSFSYSLYLVHAPLLQVIWQYDVNPLALGTTATFLLMVLVGVPAVVGTSYVFFLLFERPFLSPAHRARIGVPARSRRRSQPGPTTPQAAAAGRR